MLKEPSIKEGVATLDRSLTLMDKIVSYARDGILPTDDLEAEK